MARRGAPIPIPLKLRVRELSANSERVAAIARALGLSRGTVYKYLRQKTVQQV